MKPNSIVLHASFAELFVGWSVRPIFVSKIFKVRPDKRLWGHMNKSHIKSFPHLKFTLPQTKDTKKLDKQADSRIYKLWSNVLSAIPTLKIQKMARKIFKFTNSALFSVV